MASKRPLMAHRKRPGTSVVNGMAAPGPASCPTPRPTESCDLKVIPPRQRPVRYPKEPRDQKPLPRSCKAQYSPPKSPDVGRTHPEVEENAEVEVKLYSNPVDAELENKRPATPSTPEREPDVHVRADFHGGADSLDDDSSSDYINNTSDEDYNDGMAEEDEGVTYYIRYCPEDDSYMEGMNCSNQGECNPSQSQGDGVTPMPEGGDPTEERPEAVEGWVEEVEGEGPAEVREKEWVEDEEVEGAVREEWREEEEGVRQEWTEGDEEPREEWIEGDEEPREEWIEGDEEPREEWIEGDVEGDEVPKEEWIEGDEEGDEVPREEWRAGDVEGDEVPKEEWIEGDEEGDEVPREEWRAGDVEGDEVPKEEWIEGDEEADEVPREEWRAGDMEGEEVPREEWREGDEEPREEWREGDEEPREEWREGDEEPREELREGDEDPGEEWREEDEEVREEWIEEGQVRQEAWAGRERHLGEEWVEGEGEVRCDVVEQDPDEQIYNGRPEPILDHHHNNHHHHQPPLTDTLQDREEEEEAESEEYCPNEEEDEDGDEEERHGRAYTGDYYAPEDNGNSVRVSPYRGRKVLVVEGETGEEAEEDIDQIVAEIKISMSMGSLSSGTDQSPEELAQDPAPSDYPHPKPDAAPYPPAPHRHDSRPKSLNLPSMHHNTPDLQRGVKAHARSSEDRQRWQQEQVSNGAEQPRKQQRSDLNVPLENNNVPEPTKKVTAFPSFVDVPGPCEPEDLIDGIIFAANYLGSTQLLSERNPSKNIRMMQAQEAVSRVKRVQKAAKVKKKAGSDGDAQTLTEVDLFISTQRIKVLNADSQETMMDNALRTISYIADIGNIVVLMARRRMPRTASQDCIETTPGAPEAKKQYKMICHVFESEDAQLIAQSIGQAFSVAYQEFLRANGINPEDLSQKEYSDIINTQEMYNDDLIHFSNSENCKELQLEKSKGEILGVVIVESGWGSILPTVILANMMNVGPAARSGKLSIGDQIMSINNTSLVGLPLATCQGIIKGLKNQVQVKMNIVSCPPVTTVLIKRPDLKYQLGFSVQNGIICSLMRGGIAERGGVRVGHRIIEINGQSVVATAHEKIVQALSNSVGEIHMKTMPAAMFRLLTGQETPMYI
ncbi:amyloid-beta A4 precursor protein-binding family A member 2 isoform X1 [Gymnodraco acuticeps]|uniref:Amyloid-beta A4 precursor protein-binding family A member 2 isoform X1 n=1 Tax=Gymnodraco acuticeps TaxID=8218 RepID=A0A6P8U914_GYMAC|nr:amyloid-beta A4 precursor protein-binding family A member 2 isoform X1 [Gymnodraco acuticeps]XP_034073323.1 amyloid-beta A4 precursor protein-binding family A member 2 isoform X1 [Gymnodraco acuticeps]XP_034073328.1 amyloid-beta A4 precursor protein-binding family A member 2 isoform X1 [Gymnodraco acuticeps]XP_034073336.1 amyloid-beta A4 precursor protein-binding family A member 2 isoform X1 [Gymnodraco acuticeps]XP_034073343.1 amyloid-beta A4 precursor protein-binding family A member 2 isof